MKFSAFFVLASLVLAACGRPAELTADAKRVVDRTWNYSLYDCGGTLQANLSNTNQISVVVRGSKECSNITFYALGQTESYKIPENGSGRTGSFTIPSRMIQRDGSGYVEVTVHSNSRAHSDTVTIRYDITPERYLVRNETYSLRDCGGTINVKSWSDGERQLSFKNVRNCSNVIVDYVGSYKLSGPNQDFYGTINLRGGSYAGVTVRSNSGAHSDSFTVYFN